MSSVSKLLLDNIDTFVGIAKGRKWELRPFSKQPSRLQWSPPTPDMCPVRYLSEGYEIRLVPENKWVDFSHAPEKRPKGKCIVTFKSYNVPIIMQYAALRGQWGDGDGEFFTDSELFRDCDWHHEDGTVTPFGVEVDG